MIRKRIRVRVVSYAILIVIFSYYYYYYAGTLPSTARAFSSSLPTVQHCCQQEQLARTKLWGTRSIVQEEAIEIEKRRGDSTTDVDVDSSRSSGRNAALSFIQEQFESQKEADSTVTAPVEPQSDDLHYDSLPFSLIVDHILIKQALVVAATNPSLGVVLAGPKGTCKSVLARSVHALLPPIIDDHDHPNQRRPPCVHVPLNCQEDALLGTVNLEQSMEQGETVFEPGLLSSCHDGMLIVDDLHLLDESLATILLNAIQEGHVLVEREGLSASYPCHTLMVATYNPEEGDVRSLDQIAMFLPLRDDLDISERVQVVENVEGFQDKDAAKIADAALEDAELRTAIAKARKLLPFVTIDTEQIKYICKEATRADCEGQRAEIFATEIAKTAAALDGRIQVQARDLQLGVLLAIAPRARAFMGEPGGEDEEEIADQSNKQSQTIPPMNSAMPDAIPPPPPPPPPPEQQDQHDEAETSEESQQEDQQEEEEEEQVEEFIPEQFMFEADSTPLDPRLLQFFSWTRKGKGGKRSQIFNFQRGRFVKALFPHGDWKKARIAIGATLRAAAPFQKYRRARSPPDVHKLVHIREGDIRIKRMARKAGSLIVFVVDASGSMALNRMGAAKGAALSLLQEAYKSRDKICLVAFHGTAAEIVVPPTKSMALTRARLEQMPCGGRSPLSHGLMTAMRMGLNSLKVKQDVGRVVIVLITDGRPTVPLSESEGDLDAHADLDDRATREFCRKEVEAIAKQLGGLNDFNLVVIDTEDRFVGTGMSSRIAQVAQGNYCLLPNANAATVADIARRGVAQVRR